MNIKNILKDSYAIDNNLYYFVKRKINAEKFNDLFVIENNIKSYRHFNIEHKNNKLNVAFNESSFLPSLFIKIESYLTDEEKLSFLNILRDKKEFKIGRVKKPIFNYLHADIFILIQLLKNNKIIDIVISKKIIDYLSFELNYFRKENSLLLEIERNFTRSNFIDINKNSLYYNKFNQFIQNENLLTNEAKAEIDKIDFIDSIEVQFGFDNKRLLEFLTNLNKALNFLHISSQNSEPPKFSLKIRKIKRTKKSGIFIKHLNLIIVDPRETSSIWHELGHWMEENNLEHISIDNNQNTESLDSIKKNYHNSVVKKEIFADNVEKMILKYLN